MKALTTAGLTELITLIKNTFLEKTDTINVSDALSAVAISGSYNDLSDKPTIPTVPTIATSVSASSTNSETVGAKLFYDTCGDIETLINAL